MEPDKRSLRGPLAVFGGLLLACFVFAIVLFAAVGKEGGGSAWTSGTGPKIGVVEITGVISGSRQAIEQLIELRRDPSIKAIVLRIDSPGGAVAPSQELYRAVERARKDKKVVVSMGTVAASGGYYIAAAADKVYALPGTITGSIGVISEYPEFAALLDLARVGVRTIKSGAMKDVGSPLRAMTDEERRFLQGVVDSIYAQFVEDVAKGRKLDVNELKKIADGRILTGAEAKQLKLVDEIGNLEEAIEGAAQLAGAEGTPVPVFVKPKRSFLSEMLREGADGLVDGARQSLQRGAAGSIEARDPRF